MVACLPILAASPYGMAYLFPTHMIIRLVGLGLVGLGLLFAVFFIYLPIRNTGPVGTKALVFVPLAVVTGLAFLIGGAPVLEAFQARPKSKRQLTLVLSIIIGSGILTGIGYWQIKTRWLRPAQPVILEIPKPPELPAVRQPTPP